MKNAKMGSRDWMGRRAAVIGVMGVIGVIGAGPIGVNEARACGCFTPPDPSVPVVQAGERIVFAMKDSQVTAHIQIQYAGDAKEFGWLLPLPALPTLELGSDELFTSLIANTQPKYRLNRIYPNNGCFFGGGAQGGFASDLGMAAGDGGANGGPQPSPLVVQDSIGPYDYAVLKADNKDAMLKWLADNHYFVPAGTSDAVNQYLHPGAFFLALKLRSGKAAGDIQPVVIRYASDLPMIPIVLTSVGAKPDMGIQVWMAGPGRAIPRNYYHTVLNDAVIDWLSSGANYNDVVIRATKEADKRHTFVTEFAGASTVMKDVLDGAGRFGSTTELSQITDPIVYVKYLQTHGYRFDVGPLITIMNRYLPEPPALIKQGVTPGTWISNIWWYLGEYRQTHPDQFAGLSFDYDPKALTDEIQKSVVKPIQAAAKLFTDFPYLTRLYTTLSPADMNSDPVFSYNPGLPDVNNVHEATITLYCNMMSFTGFDGRLRTEQGFVFDVPGGFTAPTLPKLPASLRIEVLRETGAPEVKTDNTATVHDALGPYGDKAAVASGCNVEPRTTSHGVLFAVFTAMMAIGLFIRRGRRVRN